MRSRTVLTVDRRTGVGVIGEVAWSAVAAVLCLGTGLVCLVLAVARVGDRPTQLTHAAMGVAMAGMFAPWGDPVPMWVGVGAFTGCSGRGSPCSACAATGPPARPGT